MAERRGHRSTNEELHLRFNIEPINQRIYNLSVNIWARLQQTDPELVMISEQLDNYPGREHGWWPRTSVTIRNNLPEPKYK